MQDTEYDALGRVARKSNVYKLVGGTAYWARYTYDALGRVTREESPDPDAAGGIAITTLSYSGLTTVTTNSKGQTKTTTKNAQGQVAQVADTQGNTVIYTYDALGQLTPDQRGRLHHHDGLQPARPEDQHGRPRHGRLGIPLQRLWRARLAARQPGPEPSPWPTTAWAA